MEIIEQEISKHVLTISPHHKKGKGGIASVVHTLSNYYEVFNFIPSSNGGNIFNKLRYFITSIVKLLYFVLFRKIKIVHIHGASYGSFLRKRVYINICYFFKIKIIYHAHGAEFNLFYNQLNKQKKTYIVRNTLDKVNLLIALSNSWKEFYSRIIDKNKIIILNNIVLPQEQNHSKLKQKFDLLDLLFLGEIGDRKGIFDLLNVIIGHKKQLKGRLILHVGGNGDIERLKKLIDKEELHELVLFEGWVSGDKKQELLSSCDVLILPSYNEGLPISILEAMSYGLPIISTTVGGIPELIENGENGFIFTPGDKDMLWKSIDYYLSHPEEISRMGKNNCEKIKNYYPEEIIPQLNAIYVQLLNK